ncbi:hypothetical protein GJAV_G00209980 [Gymnothorax javanicus]|nr:hypothetical protein GJAV_G00209980 [Gymnothorax javanicus]
MVSVVPDMGPGPREQQQRHSRSILALTLLALTSSSLSALLLYHVQALKAEVAILRTEVLRRREEQRSVFGQPPRDRGQALHMSSDMKNDPRPTPRKQQPGTLTIQKRSIDLGAAGTVLQPCLQMIPDSQRSLTQKEFLSDSHTAIPWQPGLKRGCALQQDSDTILVNEEGFYFVYSQVYYMDKTFAMGHIIIRRKTNVVGDELQNVTLFRCIQNMDAQFPYNTCYTAGVVKLEEGDRVELLIPRRTAKISFDGDSTFFGAVKLV